MNCCSNSWPSKVIETGQNITNVNIWNQIFMQLTTQLNCVTLVQFLHQLHFRNLKKQCVQKMWNVRRSSQHVNALLARLGKTASTPQVLKNWKLTLYVEAEVSLWETKPNDQTFIRCVKWPETCSVFNIQAIGMPFAKLLLFRQLTWGYRGCRMLCVSSKPQSYVVRNLPSIVKHLWLAVRLLKTAKPASCAMLWKLLC